ncbi:hypothetical protein B0A52_08922 [Exophiala mesophila]|uniref:Major facilitator superfamily (MFS) profile domain-containing protein n=1 Tax=Exophiala mesophila TaxID=212818 RepID=A0A438MV22_EXOME|nr:hypothetical protein B0A52_08922 [Exophiala mesophila]
MFVKRKRDADGQHFEGRQFRPYNVLMVALMSLGSVGYGYNASIIATTLAQPSFNTYFELDTRPNGTQLIATMNGLYQAGGFLGVLTISWLADRWGRRFAIGVSAFICMISGALLAGSVHVGMFIAMRFLSGAGAFMIVAAVPIWMNEVVPPSVRGILVDCHSVGLLFGYALATWLGYAFYHLPETNNGAWRAPLAFQCLPVFLLLLGLRWMPESPRWLMLKDRFEEADQTLRKLHAPQEAAIELRQIQQSIQADKHLETSWWAMFTKRSYLKRSLLAIATTFSIQTSGILVINNYGPRLYSTLGFDTNRQFLYQIGWITLAFGTGILSFFVIDRFPRNKLLATGVAGCALSLLVEAVLVALYATTPSAIANPNQSGLQAAVASMYIYVCFYELCLGGVQFAYLGELFPTHIRAKGMVIGIANICVMNIMWLQAAPTAFDTIGWRFFLCFVIPGIISATLMWIFFPDTLGVPLEEIARIFGDHQELTEAEKDSGLPAAETNSNDLEKSLSHHVENTKA